MHQCFVQKLPQPALSISSISPMGHSTTVIAHVLFILLSVLLPNQASLPHTGNNPDEIALSAFRKAIQDCENALSNWNGSTDVCRWTGIDCNKLGRVSKLVLPNRSLHGTISPFLSNLSQLQYLDLSFNSFRGSIPIELGALSSLNVLKLGDNMLQLGIPDSFGMLAKLEFFDLSDNELNGTLPTSVFYNCTQLKVVNISNNSLHGPIPPQLGTRLNGLEKLSLAFNWLTGSIPASLSNATKLTNISLHFNSLSGQLPSDIVVHLPSLKILSISYNNLSSDEQGKDLSHFFRAISNLTHLYQLGLGGNNLSGTLSSMVDLPHVSYLFLQENKLQGTIPSNISKFENLTLLNLFDNLLGGTIPLGLLHHPKLERAWLSDNLLHGQIPSFLNVSTTHLGILDLSGNNLSGKIPFSISKLTSMRILQLNDNSLVGSIPSSLGCMILELLDLSHNQLTGHLPAEVASLGTLQHFFNLSHNLLEGVLPRELSNMNKVQAIVLSSNNFSSRIPIDIRNCLGVEELDLSNNSLQGPIPEYLGTLKGLQSLDLSSNLLSGEVPASLNQCTSLKQLNLSFNQLIGALPHGGVFDSLTFESLEGNNLCGLEGFPSCDSRKRSITHSRKLLVLLLVSIISSILFFVVVIFRVAAAKTIRGTALDASRRSINLFSSHPRITYRELWEATGGFDQSRLIGSGGFGHVYRATLCDGSLVAIKVLQLQDHNSSRTFDRECQVLKRIRHRNLMSIITACSRPEFKALVLPFISKGSLEDHLYPQGDQIHSHLSLTERVNICSDAAEGMAYLHHHAPVQVIHCDLKPSNILLSNDMTAIVTDFGIARLVSTVAEESASADSMISSTSALLCGSVGYVAPEYGYGRIASTKGDVYSFGIVVLEMVTGKRPTDDMFHEGLSLVNWVKYQYHSHLENIIDSSLVRDLKKKGPEVKKILEVAIIELIDLSLLCTQEAPSNRPTMISVADDLNKLKLYLGGDATAIFTSSYGMTSVTDIGDDL